MLTISLKEITIHQLDMFLSIPLITFVFKTERMYQVTITGAIDAL